MLTFLLPPIILSVLAFFCILASSYTISSLLCRIHPPLILNPLTHIFSFTAPLSFAILYSHTLLPILQHTLAPILP